MQSKNEVHRLCTYAMRLNRRARTSAAEDVLAQAYAIARTRADYDECHRAFDFIYGSKDAR